LCRTAGQTPFEVAIWATEPPPAYAAISHEAYRLHCLGLSNRTIARHLGVTDKTVAKAVRWYKWAKGPPR